MKTASRFTVLITSLIITACASPPLIEEPIDFSTRARLVDGPEGARLIFPDGLLFDFAKSSLKTEASSNIDACMFIIERSRGAIIVEGHTDSVGSRAANGRLSQERAEIVKGALVSRKVAPGRIEVRALADTKPEVARATTEHQHAQNRRAEIIFKGETVESLRAPYGCGDPPVKRPAPRSSNVFDQLGEEITRTVNKINQP